jgi:DNA-directed RNA polymerase subunit alpha
VGLLSKNWKTLIKPTLRVLEDQDTVYSEKEKTFIIEPLERGFDITLGNALRRILLSSLQGSAITSIKIEGVLHEFSSVPGMREDVTDLVLNLKGTTIKMHSAEHKTVYINAAGPCVVTAGMIETGLDVEIMNPDHIICHLDKGANLKMQLTCQTGKGYVPSVKQESKENQVGTINIDAIFSPINSVVYRVENSRIGNVTDYGKLIITIATNGTISPDTALGLAAKILQEQLQVFICFEDSQIADEDKKGDLPFDKNLLRKVDEMEISVRAQNCLRNDNIMYIGDLVTRTESDMLKTPNFGRKSLNEIKELLASMGLKFGMEIPGWPPQNVEELSKSYEDPFK